MITKKGFTLIELLTVIAIIGILAGLLIPAASKAMKDSAIRKAQATIASLETALSMYYTDYGVYPPSCVSPGTAAGDQRNGNAFVTPISGTNLVGALSATTKGGPYMKFRNEDLQRSGSQYVLIDPWGRAYVYVSRSYLSSSVTGIGPYHPNTTDVTKNTYNIYSLGPDDRTYGGVRYSDAGGDDWDLSTMYDGVLDGDSDDPTEENPDYNRDDINNW